MLETKELEKYIRERLRTTLPDLNLEKKLNFCIGTNGWPGTIFIYTQNNTYHYISIGDKGEPFHKEFTSENDVLWAILQSELFQICANYARDNRQPEKDSRRTLFAKQIELFSKFGEEFEKRKVAEINEILRKCPYNDGLYERTMKLVLNKEQ